MNVGYSDISVAPSEYYSFVQPFNKGEHLLNFLIGFREQTVKIVLTGVVNSLFSCPVTTMPAVQN
jgi:hypothetical protein